MTDDFVCEQCCNCHWYYLNTDNQQVECMGQEKPCDEYMYKKTRIGRGNTDGHDE